MSAPTHALFPQLERWLLAEPAIKSAVLFGSHARESGTIAAADSLSDIDLHIITSSAERIVTTDWVRTLEGHELCLRVLRPATGRTKKLTLVFEQAEVDMVLLGAGRMRLASMALALGLHRRFNFVAGQLNILSTIMRGGYRFLKGERNWGRFYASVVKEMAGYRLNNSEVRELADNFLCDLLWVLQKLERGELVAAQRVIHKALQETNILLMHEFRMRNSLPTFQQARRVEQLLSSRELEALCLDTRLERSELVRAARRANFGLELLMRELAPEWKAPMPMQKLLYRHGLTPAT